MNIDNITSESMTLNNNGKSTQIKVYEELICKLQSNWNSLREWLEGLKNYEEIKDKMFYIGSIQVLQDVLDKMNELEGKDNDGTMD